MHKPELSELAKELRLDVTDAPRQPDLTEVILAVEAEDYELAECLEFFSGRQDGKRQAKSREQ